MVPYKLQRLDWLEIYFSDTLRIMACCYLFERTCRIFGDVQGKANIRRMVMAVVFWGKDMKQRGCILCHLLNEGSHVMNTFTGNLSEVIPRYFSAWVSAKLTEERPSIIVGLSLDERVRHKSFTSGG